MYSMVSDKQKKVFPTVKVPESKMEILDRIFKSMCVT